MFRLWRYYWRIRYGMRRLAAVLLITFIFYMASKAEASTLVKTNIDFSDVTVTMKDGKNTSDWNSFEYNGKPISIDLDVVCSESVFTNGEGWSQTGEARTLRNGIDYDVTITGKSWPDGASSIQAAKTVKTGIYDRRVESFTYGNRIVWRETTGNDLDGNHYVRNFIDTDDNRKANRVKGSDIYYNAFVLDNVEYNNDEVFETDHSYCNDCDMDLSENYTDLGKEIGDHTPMHQHGFSYHSETVDIITLKTVNAIYVSDDYSYNTWSINKPGNYTVTISGKGDYKGTVTADVIVTPGEEEEEKTTTPAATAAPTKAPEKTETKVTPAVTAKPTATPKPATPTKAPQATTPAPTKAPAKTTPVPTKKPSAVPTKAPAEATQKPAVPTKKPAENSSKTKTTPKSTAGPKPTSKPKPTVAPKPTTTPKPVQKPVKPPVSASTVQKKILSTKANKDVQNSAYGALKASLAKAKKKSIKIKWSGVKGAVSYTVYGAKSGKRYKKLKDVKGKSYTQKKLKKGTWYKYIVVAKGSKGQALSVSKAVYAATSGGKAGNAKKIKLSAKKLKLAVGKSKNLKAKEKTGKGKKAKKLRKLSWESSDPSVATVSTNGKVKAKKAGKCIIYAYAQDGICAKCSVTVARKQKSGTKILNNRNYGGFIFE